MLESIKATYKKFRERNLPNAVIEGMYHDGETVLQLARLKEIPQVLVLNDGTYKYHLIKQKNEYLQAVSEYKREEAEIETLIFEVERPRTLFTKDGRIFVEEDMRKREWYLQSLKDTEDSVKQSFAKYYKN